MPHRDQQLLTSKQFPESPQIRECWVDKSEVDVTCKAQVISTLLSLLTAEYPIGNDDHKSTYSINWLTEAFNVKKKVLERQGYVK